MDGMVCVLKANANLTNFTVLRRLPNPHKLFPLQCCYVPEEDSEDGSGYVVTASEDSAVRAFDLDSFEERQLQNHNVPVVGLAASGGASLVASGDVRGLVSLWRTDGGEAT